MNSFFIRKILFHDMQYPKHINTIHKGQIGRVLIIGGSPQYYGAPILTALAAEFSGADLISLYIPANHLEAAKKYSLNFLLYSFPQHPGYLSLYDVKIVQEISANAIVIGNGMGRDFDAKKAMLAIINTEKPVVIDGDALIPEILKIYNSKKHKWILTPHAGEFERVFACKATPENIVSVAKEFSLNLCVKGPTDHIIACNDFAIDSYDLLLNGENINHNKELYENETGVPQMRIGGTGDALAGIICSYVSQGFSALQAMRAATYLFGKCGEEMLKHRSHFSAKALIKFFAKLNASKE